MEDKLNKLITDVEVIKAKIDALTSHQFARIDDHESRIRGLETFKSKFIGAIIVGNFLAGTIAGIIVGIITRGA
jgi:hypothetical protein